MYYTARLCDFLYGDKISLMMKREHLAIGDSIRLDIDGSIIEGEIMPSTEVNNPEILIIKLKNGYNLGIRYDQQKIEKVVSERRVNSFPQLKIEHKEGMKNISLIYTGGTIGSKIDYTTGGVYMLTKPEELLYEIPEISEIANVSIIPLLSIASEDMSFVEWQKIAKTVYDELDKGRDGIVITHGTDTMHYTAAALSFMLRNLNAPVILTGSQRSSDRGSSDAFMNLLCSAHAASKSDIAEVGICMHNSSSDDVCTYIRGVKARKMHTSRRDAFRPINSKPIAHIKQNGEINYISDYKKVVKGKNDMKLIDGFEKNVALVKFYPNSSPDILKFYIEKGCKGIIIEGTGLGHVAVSTIHNELNWLPAIKEAISRGIIVGMTSQCLYGRVHPDVYRNLRILSSSGVIYCNDMSPETALIKLGWLLGNYKKDEAEKLLNTNIAGELSSRSEYDNFLV